MTLCVQSRRSPGLSYFPNSHPEGWGKTTYEILHTGTHSVGDTGSHVGVTFVPGFFAVICTSFFPEKEESKNGFEPP